MNEVFFTTPLRRAAASLVFGLVASFVLGSFLSFFIFFTAQAVEGQSHDAAKTTVFRVYAAVFLLTTLALHFYATFWFRKDERKPLFEFKPPRPVIAGVLAALFLFANAIPSTTVTESDRFEHARNPLFKESSFGWPAYFAVHRNAYGETSTEWSRAFLLINGLILLLGAANVFAFDPTTRIAGDEAAAREEDAKAKKPDDDTDETDSDGSGEPPSPPPPPPPSDDGPDLRKTLTKEPSTPRTLDLD